ncbi:PQQ-dependent sugar dehydrogenase [Pseudoxanthomonas beigongshangi]
MRRLPLVLLLGLAACRPEVPAPAVQPHVVRDAVPVEYASENGAYAVTELVAGLEHPWALAFLPDGGILVTERPGRLRRISADGEVSAPIAGLPAIFVDGQAGLLDVALSPQFTRDRWVYLAFAEPTFRGNKAGTAVARGRLEGDALQDVEVVYRQEPKLSHGTHVGARLVFDDAGHLFVTQGDNRVAAAAAQELDKLQGKLVRIWPDGRIPDDNPFVDKAGARPEVWSYGHRNMQGAALHPVTRALWTSEHGPQGGDEINLPQAGANYGWPLATHGIDYSGKPVEGARGRSLPGMQDPHYVWEKSPAVSGMAFYTGGLFPHWQGDLFLGALAARQLIRLELDGDRIVHEERLLGERNQRIRDVRQGPDGALYVLVDAPDGKLLRIAPPVPGR